MARHLRKALNKVEEWASWGQYDFDLCYCNNTFTEPYEYQPLPATAATNRAIRLLVLLPGPEKSEVECMLKLADLDHTVTVGKQGDGDEDEGFEALSYVWGDETETTRIQVDDKTISITKSLCAALIHLRSAHKPRTLWVDALCINQDDVEEKNRQLPLMGDIYSTAARAVIWLGCPCCVLGFAGSGYESGICAIQLEEQVKNVVRVFAAIKLLSGEARAMAAEGPAAAVQESRCPRLLFSGNIVDSVTKLSTVQPAFRADEVGQGPLEDDGVSEADSSLQAELEAVQKYWEAIGLDSDRIVRDILSGVWKTLKTSKDKTRKTLAEALNMVKHWECFLDSQDYIDAEFGATSSNREASTLFRDILTTSTFHPSGPVETQKRFEQWLKELNLPWIRKLKKTKLEQYSPTMFKSIIYAVSGWEVEGDDPFSSYTGHVAHRRVRITGTGRFKRACLLPKLTAIGDKIALLRGGRVPVVLRPRGDGSMEFIGEALLAAIGLATVTTAHVTTIPRLPWKMAAFLPVVPSS
ncbi:heterokaryon incompatibility protein-domain-containing protein [Cladorrhinum sp. PSN332]|nr:heterokaryon incompatibility protein-domain-containing protein [Cladorrhinum sp. PSN332]